MILLSCTKRVQYSWLGYRNDTYQSTNNFTANKQNRKFKIERKVENRVKKKDLRGHFSTDENRLP